MSKKHQITKDIFDKYFESEEEFALDDLINEIKEEGGSRSIAAGYKLKDYLEDLVSQKILLKRTVIYFRKNKKHA